MCDAVSAILYVTYMMYMLYVWCMLIPVVLSVIGALEWCTCCVWVVLNNNIELILCLCYLYNPQCTPALQWSPQWDFQTQPPGSNTMDPPYDHHLGQLHDIILTSMFLLDPPGGALTFPVSLGHCDPELVLTCDITSCYLDQLFGTLCTMSTRL